MIINIFTSGGKFLGGFDDEPDEEALIIASEHVASGNTVIITEDEIPDWVNDIIES